MLILAILISFQFRLRSPPSPFNSFMVQAVSPPRFTIRLNVRTLKMPSAKYQSHCGGRRTRVLLSTPFKEPSAEATENLSQYLLRN